METPLDVDTNAEETDAEEMELDEDVLEALSGEFLEEASEEAAPGVRDRNIELRALYLELEKERAVALEAGDTSLAQRLHERMRDRVGGEFYLNNQGLAFSVAKQFFGSWDSNSEDYLQDATLGLWEAFTKWDPKRGTFGTFSRTYIAGKTQRGVRVVEYNSISHSDFTARKHILKKVRELEAKWDRAPSHEEVRAETGYTTNLIERVRQHKTASLDQPVGDGGTTLGGLISEREAAITTIVDEASWWGYLKETTKNLDPDELLVLARREGWDGAWRQSLVEIAALTGEGRGTISRKENDARAKLTGPCPAPLS